MSDVLAYFDTGQRHQIDESTIWHGNAWVRDDGSLSIPAGPETRIKVRERGTSIYHDGKRCW